MRIPAKRRFIRIVIEGRVLIEGYALDDLAPVNGSSIGANAAGQGLRFDHSSPPRFHPLSIRVEHVGRAPRRYLTGGHPFDGELEVKEPYSAGRRVYLLRETFLRLAFRERPVEGQIVNVHPRDVIHPEQGGLRYPKTMTI